MSRSPRYVTERQAKAIGKAASVLIEAADNAVELVEMMVSLLAQQAVFLEMVKGAPGKDAAWIAERIGGDAAATVRQVPTEDLRRATEDAARARWAGRKPS